MPKKRYLPINLDRVKTYPILDRPTKVELSKFAQLVSSDSSLLTFLDSLPSILKANELRSVVDAIIRAKNLGKPVIVGFGGHVIKCGLGPLIIHLMENNIITALCMNGGASIHDFEIAIAGQTSEDVGASLGNGMFGMVKETPELMNSAISKGATQSWGMGQALGESLLENDAPYVQYSVLVAGARLNIPTTVHTVIGGDTIHMHPSMDPALFGLTTFRDFRLLASVLQDMDEGGVYLNIGSAVVLPEVFLKALNLARNLSKSEIKNFTTVNMDMIQHYRPSENVLRRPTLLGGDSYSLTGHHEIMVPLLFQLVLAKLGQTEQ